ncbi:efflux transporter, RND family, MFP subunit [Anaeromyxobacter dehalogenans 2CP-1]|uniref:Efflux transporter, RND family, MFP subunit n=1 Tax=Anaeromyxobacter dehalogenans (strain ATCC BAA-258 / DSM 21875 / 2CP-1) TaxID=455488 RepID=B8JBY2_ANAD2|nr:efflux RND transporter periplasmic adaptor subunit [Anaeromyxobacter dehalogenans]ACL63904.1 efflux transporter, RND family, MFP subunit [Anaeromyxobacter dehalogenans 2CP-1]
MNPSLRSPRAATRRAHGLLFGKRALALAALALVAAGCGKKPEARPPGPVEVGVITVSPQAVTLTTELPGRVSAFKVAEVRARVNGIVLKRLFTEGSDVKQGQPLFKIDPAPYQAALDSARAQLARADATLASAKLTSERYTELVAANAVSRQEHEDAVAALKKAEADVAAGKAAVDAARINLGYTTVTSPVSGRIGRSGVTEGAYVQAAQATLLATVQQLDPVYVDVTQSSAELLRMRRDLEAGKLQSAGAGKAKVALTTEDGREYGLPGTLQFADVTVDPGTGSVALRAIFPNPRAELLPGTYVRARLAEGVNPAALLVPQRAVARNNKGEPTALIVAGGKVELRNLVTERVIGDAWLVTSGVKPGEQVIVEGLQKVRPGAPVNPVPAGGAKQANAATPGQQAPAGAAR